MDNKENYKLIYDLFDYIILFDDNDKITFEGSELKKLLSDASININNLDSQNTNHAGQIKLFNETISKVRFNLQPQSFKFSDIQDEFILIPLYFDDTLQIILTQKEKIDQITNIEHDLQERVKELRCLYNVSKELEAARSLYESFEKCLNHVQAAFQFPEDTIVIFEIGKKTFNSTKLSQETVTSSLSSDINVNDKKFGQIKILLRNKNRFLEEEQKMIDEIANKFARAIEESEKTINLEKQQKILLAKNEALLRLTD